MFQFFKKWLSVAVLLLAVATVADALHFSPTLRTARSQAINATIGASPFLCLYNGTIPANCAAAANTVAVNMTLPAEPFTVVNGVLTKAGTWAGNATANTTINYYRFLDSAGNCHVQGNVTSLGGGGEIMLDNPTVTDGQFVQISSYTTTEGNL